jgi:hypothetical protein
MIKSAPIAQVSLAAVLFTILASGLSPAAAATATAEPTFPRADLQAAARAPDLATWIYERLSLAPPNLSAAEWQNGSAGDGPFARAFRYNVNPTAANNVLDYASDGSFLQAWLDVATSIRPADMTDAGLRAAALDVAQRLGIPTEGLRIATFPQGRAFATLDGGFPWGAGVETQHLFLRFDGPLSALDRLVISPWFTGGGSPTVTTEAAQATALAAARERGTGELLRVAAVGGSVVGGSHPAWAVTIIQGNCSAETSYYFVDAENGTLLGRQGGTIADGVCAPMISSMPVIGWVFASLLVGAATVVVAWRWRSKPAQGHDQP